MAALGWGFLDFFFWLRRERPKGCGSALGVGESACNQFQRSFLLLFFFITAFLLFKKK